MKSSVEKLSETRVKLTVTVPFDELKGEIDQAYSAIAQQVTIPGFRRGKAPRQLIDARFGRGVILEQVVNDMLPSRYGKALEENDVNPLGQPDVNVTKVDDGVEVEFEAQVDVRPEFTTPDFSTFEITVDPLAVTDEQVDAEIERLRSRFAELKDTDRELADKDFAVVDLTVFVDGEEQEDRSSKGMSYQVGEGSLFGGLDEALVGLKAGDEKEFTTELKNEGESTVKVRVNETKEQVLPEVDEEFVQMASEYDTVEELRENTKSKLEEDAKIRQASSLRDQVLTKALEETEFPLPEGAVDAQIEAQTQQIMGQLGDDESLFNRLLEAQGTSREEYDAKQREDAEKAVRTQLFLDTLADEKDVQTSKDEITEHAYHTAQSYGMEPAQFMSAIVESGQIGNLVADVRRSKALAQAICEVSVADTEGNEVDPKEYFGDESEEENTAAEESEEK